MAEKNSSLKETSEKRYSAISHDTVFDCKISVMTTQAKPLKISCIVGQFTGFYDPAEYEHYNAFSVYNC
ncbi:hypothetical protein KQX54_000404 [Cotesia glomerata]|uniref:Uncharacterized protein n=1 Tax=Cotesia glomerata TaxID=32391 RepID=A0AAV7I0A6_COTGL|nr:hypothetical protein KQX54_000404 [Cotesia glomerata]